MSTQHNDGGPALPIPTEYITTEHPGMSLRDWFAGQALAPLIRKAQDVQMSNELLVARIAQLAYLAADAMLKAREESK